MKILWASQTQNRKTGNMPTGLVGATPAETRRSCRGCALLDAGCYAWSGTVGWHMAATQEKARVDPHQVTLEQALGQRLVSARAARLGSIGDPGRLPYARAKAIQEQLDAAGLALLAYTHFWKKRGGYSAAPQRNKEIMMASCDSIAEADEAIDRGWKAAAIGRHHEPGPVVKTPRGRRLLLCPAQSTHNQTQCNECLLCDPRRLVRYDGIVFRAHGRDAGKIQV